MHESRIPKPYLERVMAKQGRLHVTESVEPNRVALLVIDMQNFFVAADHALC